MGTPVYMPPEQTKGKADLIDERSDVFTLGGILYQILTGGPPHEPGPPLRVMVQAHRCIVRPPDEACGDPRLPLGLALVAIKALSAEPADRYQTVQSMIDGLEVFSRGAWHVPRQHLAAGTRVVTEGEAGDEAFIIVSGTLVVFRDRPEGRTILTRLGPGEVFGEMSVFTQAPRTASVDVEADAVLMVVRGDTLQDALGMNGWVGVFVRTLANRLLRTGE